MGKLKIRVYSKATSVKGQGVGSAYLEQLALVKEDEDLEICFKGKAPIHHIHTVNPSFLFAMNRRSVSIVPVHFLPTTFDGSIRLPKPIFYLFKKYVIHFYKKADEIVVVNPSFVSPLMELGIPKERITYIPNYVSPDSFFPMKEEEKEKIKEEYGIPKDRFLVLGCGQVQNRKGVFDFIEVAKKNPDFFFLWAGGFSFGAITDGYKELKKVVENPPENVTFLGIIDREKMNGIYNIADVLFMPSFSELFPMAILEAVSTHTPILLRDLPLYEEILFSSYGKASDIEGFSSFLRRLATDPEFKKEQIRKAEEIASFYSKDRVKGDWNAYYKRVYEKYATKKKLP